VKVEGGKKARKEEKEQKEGNGNKEK